MKVTVKKKDNSIPVVIGTEFQNAVVVLVVACYDAQVSQNGGACANGGNIAAVSVRPGNGIHSLLAAPDGGNAAQAAGQHDHGHFGKVHFFQGHIRHNADAVTAVHGLAVDANGGNLHTGSAQHIHRSQCLNLFKPFSAAPNASFEKSRLLR